MSEVNISTIYDTSEVDIDIKKVKSLEEIFDIQIYYLKAKRDRTDVEKKKKSYSDQMKRLAWNRAKIREYLDFKGVKVV